MKKKNKGSLTLEAVIAFTIFISFMFMLLTIVKLSIIRITLNVATTETVKQIATSAYPLSSLMEWQRTEQKKIKHLEGRIKVSDGIKTTVNAQSLFANNTKVNSIGGAFNSAMDLFGGINKVKVEGHKAVQNLVGDIYNKEVSILASNIFNDIVDNMGVPMDKEKIDIAIVKFPEPEECATALDVEVCDMAGITSGSYVPEDMVLSVEYNYELALPFLPSFEIVMRETAIEHPWIYGGNGAPVKRGDQSILKKESDAFQDIVFGKDRVYLGAMLAGRKYHKKNCRTLSKGSIVTSKEQAKKEFYTPCKVCKPDGD